MDHGKDKRAEAQARIASTLGAYEAVAGRLSAGGWEPATYHAAAELFMQLQQEAAALPDLREVWIPVLVSRFEFTHTLWETRNEAQQPAKLLETQRRHAAALAALKAACGG